MAEEAYIAETQRVLGALIKRPALVDKFLAKPPFRFIHDITKSVIRETGYMGEVFSEDELNADNIQDKEGKLNFLTKVISSVEQTLGTKLPTKATKIAAGLEPENTNLLLQKLAEAATAGKGKKSSSSSKKEKSESSSSSSKKESSSSSSKKSSSSRGDEPRRGSDSPEKSRKGSDSPEKSRKGSDSPEKSRKGSDSPEKSRKGSDSPEKSRSSRKEESSEKSERSRKGSDSPEKSRSSRKDESPERERRRRDDDGKEMKKTSSKEKGKERADKDEEAIKKLMQAEEQKKKEREERDREKEKERDKEREKEREKEKERERAERAEREKEKEKEREREKEKERERAEREKEKEREREKAKEKQKEEESPRNEDIPAEADVRQRNARPVTARRAPPKQQTNVRTVEKVNKSDKTEAVVAAPQVIAEGAAKDDADDLIVKIEAKVDDDIPVIQDDNEQHGMLVKNILNTNKELQRGTKENGPSTTKIRDTKEMAKEKLQKEVEQLRESIQALTRGANPLGKCVDFVPEDIESMDKELESWKAENIKQTQLVEEEERLTEQSLQPFYAKMNELDIQIKEQLAKINSTKAKMSENDAAINQMLYMVVKS
eukprot:Phypoly_transcript_00330.p2 GENE.Phypoly_transcript_00330~~Phypoly_transcript_00330.p2  ORF type:complete len:604 (+),score=213.80 Phypoly_transcript_00330:151-1962(+)